MFMFDSIRECFTSWLLDDYFIDDAARTQIVFRRRRTATPGATQIYIKSNGV